MARFIENYRQHREIARTRRALNDAINTASSASMRDELILIAQRLNADIR